MDTVEPKGPQTSEEKDKEVALLEKHLAEKQTELDSLRERIRKHSTRLIEYNDKAALQEFESLLTDPQSFNIA